MFLGVLGVAPDSSYTISVTEYLFQDTMGTMLEDGVSYPPEGPDVLEPGEYRFFTLYVGSMHLEQFHILLLSMIQILRRDLRVGRHVLHVARPEEEEGPRRLLPRVGARAAVAQRPRVLPRRQDPKQRVDVKAQRAQPAQSVPGAKSVLN